MGEDIQRAENSISPDGVPMTKGLNPRDHRGLAQQAPNGKGEVALLSVTPEQANETGL